MRYLAIDSGYGDEYSAAQEVEYVNGPATSPMGKLRAANGHSEPFKVNLWCIGNEMYGFWQAGHMSANQYAEKHGRIVKAMKKVDPTIKVTSAGATPSELSMMTQENKQFIPNFWWPAFPNDLPYKFESIHDYDYWLLKNSSDYIDHISEHTYCYPELSFDQKKQLFVDLHDPLETQARRMTNRMGQAFESWDYYVSKMPDLKSKNMKFIFDEWGTRFPQRQWNGNDEENRDGHAYELRNLPARDVPALGHNRGQHANLVLQPDRARQCRRWRRPYCRWIGDQAHADSLRRCVACATGGQLTSANGERHNVG